MKNNIANCFLIALMFLPFAFLFGQGDYSLTLVGRISFPVSPAGCYNTDTTGGSDVWGYTAPDGAEYAIMGVKDGVAVVKVPELQVIDIVPGPASGDCWFHRDIKTYSHYAYIVAEMNGTNQGMMILDLQYLPDSVRFVGSYVYGSDVRSHNLSIDVNRGFAYICKQNYTGFRIVDLSNPESPVEVTTVNTGNIHDVYARNDTVYVAEGFNGTYSIWDVSDKNNPVMLVRFFPSGAGYAHNIWASEDGRYVMTTEETVGRTVKIWNIEDMNNVTLLGSYLGGNSLAHNTHWMGNLAVIAHYSYGVSVVDVSNPLQPVEVARYDTYLADDAPGFWGCWGAYPFSPSGYVYASDINGYLTVLQLEQNTTAVEPPQSQPDGFYLYQNYPNPFNPETTIRYRLDKNSHVEVTIFTVSGQHVKTLIRKLQSPGIYSVNWDGRDERGKPVSSGIYVYRLTASEGGQTRNKTSLWRKMVLVR